MVCASQLSFLDGKICAIQQPSILLLLIIITNEEVCAKIQQEIGPQKDLLTIIKRCKLKSYEHVSHSTGLAKTILQGTVKRGTEKEVGRQHQGMDRPGDGQVPESSGGQRKMEETGCEVIFGAPMTPKVKG